MCFTSDSGWFSTVLSCNLFLPFAVNTGWRLGADSGTARGAMPLAHKYPEDGASGDVWRKVSEAICMYPFGV